MELKDMKLIHIMADGTVRDSVVGYVIPYNENTKIAYDLLAQAERTRREKLSAQSEQREH